MKVFIILSRPPFPLEKGDKLRAYHQIKYLSQYCQVHLCCISDSAIPKHHKSELEKLCHTLYLFELNRIKLYPRIAFGLFSDKPFQVLYFKERKIQKQVSALIEQIKPDQIYAQLIRTAEYVKNEYSYPKTLDYMDALSKGIQRRLKDANFVAGFFLKMEYNRLLRYENLIFDYFDQHLVISETDRDFLYHPQKEKIAVLPNGVDFDYFKVEKTREAKYDLLFTGNMAYPPNIDCAKFIVKNILPIVQRKFPKVRLLIAGANPKPEIQSLENSAVHVSGWMDDIREAYANAKIFLAPMQIGTGLQNKLLEAMAMHLPCITSPLANAGLNAEANKEVLIGENAEQFAELCISLLENSQKRMEIAKNGHTFVKGNFHWEKTNEKLLRTLKENKI